MKKILVVSSILIIFLIRLYQYYSYPKILKEVKKSDKLGIVKETKEIRISGMKTPINACLEEHGSNYILSFRICEKENNYIGLTHLDNNFKEIGKYKVIDVKSTKAEDARIIKHENEYYLVYNDQIPFEHTYRAMHLAKLNDKKDQTDFITTLDLHIKTIEKNWVPFVAQNNLFFAYGLVPHKILELKNTKENDLKHLIFQKNVGYSRFFWNWGEPRGGSCGKLVGDEYLAFFHSSFGKSKRRKFYVMGAYTFQAKSPYKITKVSKFPILLSDSKKTRIYFPTGFVIKKENNKDMIYLSYGVNDETSKIAVIDKDKLFENMKEVY